MLYSGRVRSILRSRIDLAKRKSCSTQCLFKKQSARLGCFGTRKLPKATSEHLGHPLDVTTDIGAVSSARQLARNQNMLARALEQGARLRTGGQVIAPVPGGQYMSPAVLDAVRPDMDIARQEVFGPVLAVMPFDDEAEAIRLANGTEYGLASGVWTSSLSRAHRMVRAIKAGVVHVNTYGGPDITVTLGGVRQSGNGHDKSMHALDKYLDLKTAWIQL